MNTPFVARLLVAIVAVAMAARAGQDERPWATKDWRQWTKEDCEKVLYDSPWGKRTERQDVLLEPRTYHSGTTCYSEPQWYPDWPPNVVCQNSYSQGWEKRTDSWSFSYQFRSALPVRLAHARLWQLSAGYDALSPEARDALDRQIEAELAKKYDDVVILRVRARARPLGWTAVLITPDDRRTLPLSVSSTQIDGGEREIEIVFPRTVDGKPAFLEGQCDGQVIFGWRKPPTKKMIKKGEIVVWWSYDMGVPVGDMNYKGVLEY